VITVTTTVLIRNKFIILYLFYLYISAVYYRYRQFSNRINGNE